jgi:hypothetical protein
MEIIERNILLSCIVTLVDAGFIITGWPDKKGTSTISHILVKEQLWLRTRVTPILKCW